MAGCNPAARNGHGLIAYEESVGSVSLNRPTVSVHEAATDHAPQMPGVRFTYEASEPPQKSFRRPLQTSSIAEPAVRPSARTVSKLSWLVRRSGSSGLSASLAVTGAISACTPKATRRRPAKTQRPDGAVRWQAGAGINTVGVSDPSSAPPGPVGL